MSDAPYAIVFQGLVADGADEAAVRANLAKLFNADAARIEGVDAAVAVLLARGIAPAVADRGRAAARRAVLVDRSAVTLEHDVGLADAARVIAVIGGDLVASRASAGGGLVAASGSEGGEGERDADEKAVEFHGSVPRVEVTGPVCTRRAAPKSL